VEAIRGNSCNSWTAKGAEVGVVQPEKVTTLNQDMTGNQAAFDVRRWAFDVRRSFLLFSGT